MSMGSTAEASSGRFCRQKFSWHLRIETIFMSGPTREPAREEPLVFAKRPALIPSATLAQG